MYNISIPPQRFLFRHLAPADEQSGSSDWGGIMTAARARLRAAVISTVLVQEERRKEPTRPYMNNETLTRKQNQKTCDLSNFRPAYSPLLRTPYSSLDGGQETCKDAGSGGIPGAAMRAGPR